MQRRRSHSAKEGGARGAPTSADPQARQEVPRRTGADKSRAMSRARAASEPESARPCHRERRRRTYEAPSYATHAPGVSPGTS
eukprot:4284024-Heterocapsa_arctica.AAC.1